MLPGEITNLLSVSSDQNMIWQSVEYQAICQLYVRMHRSKHDLSINISNHLSVLIKNVQITVGIFS